MDLSYDIIATGSKGNAVRIENIMIDAGIPYNKLKPFLYKVDTLLLTHAHSDHVKQTTVGAIKKNFPHIKVIGNYDIAYKTNLDIISNVNIPIRLKKGVEIIPFLAPHDIMCQGFIMNIRDLSVLYATDIANLDHVPPEGKFDYMFLESNHDAVRIEKLIGDRKMGYNAFSRGVNHLSTQQCKGFYYMRRRSKESELIELHQSNRFY